jgi:hypothetical protein
MEEYINKIGKSFNNYLRGFISNMKEIVVRGLTLEILKLNNTLQPKIEFNNIKPHELLSGRPVTVNIQGTFEIMQKIKGGARKRFIEYWANNSVIKFNPDTEDFEIINVPEILFIDMNM